MIARLSVLALALGLSGVAHADAFEKQAADATEVHSTDGLSALFWSVEADCKRTKNDFERRQCEGVLESRRSKVVGKRFLVQGDRGLEVGKLDEKAKTIAVNVTACLACDEGVERYVVGEGGHKAGADGVTGSKLKGDTMTFSSVAEAKHWQEHVAPRVRTQFLFKLKRSPATFKAKGTKGYKVDIVGYRVFDPCKGKVLWSKPTASDAPVDVSTCKGEPTFKKPEPKKKVVKEDKKPKGPVLPDRLTTAQINDALAPARAGAQKCFQAYGIAGTASFRLTIGGDGQLKAAEQTGDFKGTPTGQCVDKAVRSVKFPKSKKKETSVTYPIVLQ